MGLTRLIFPKRIEIARFNTLATKQAGHVDEKLGELRVTNANDGTARTMPRVEGLVQLRAQIETSTFLQMQLGGLGNAASSRRVAVCMTEDLARLGLIGPDGLALLKSTDRLARILTLDGVELEVIAELPGLYATQVQPCGYGYGRGRANLVELSFESRATGPAGGGSGFG